MSLLRIAWHILERSYNISAGLEDPQECDGGIAIEFKTNGERRSVDGGAALITTSPIVQKVNTHC
jgi:hypothetical protein